MILKKRKIIFLTKFVIGFLLSPILQADDCRNFGESHAGITQKSCRDEGGPRVCIYGVCTAPEGQNREKGDYKLHLSHYEQLTLGLLAKELDNQNVSNSKLTDLNNTVQLLNNKLEILSNEMAAYRTLVDKQVLDAKVEMMKSIQNIPIEVVKDETAYKLLKAKLEKDLAEAFQPKY